MKQRIFSIEFRVDEHRGTDVMVVTECEYNEKWVGGKRTSDTHYFEILTQSLDACFKWLVPKVISVCG